MFNVKTVFGIPFKGTKASLGQGTVDDVPVDAKLEALDLSVVDRPEYDQDNIDYLYGKSEAPVPPLGSSLFVVNGSDQMGDSEVDDIDGATILEAVAADYQVAVEGCDAGWYSYREEA